MEKSGGAESNGQWCLLDHIKGLGIASQALSCLNKVFRKKVKERKVEEVWKISSWHLGCLQLTNLIA